MDNTSRRSAVLLGAGASKDAGLPLTDQLSSQMISTLNAEHPDSNRPDWLSALNFVYSAIVSYQARDGSSPMKAVNIERLISALRLLRDRETHEAAPFVDAWRDPVLPPGHVRADEHTARFLVSSIAEALGLKDSAGGSQRQAQINAAYYIAEIAESAKTPTRRDSFKRADEMILGRLGTFLNVARPVDYLYPLVRFALTQAGGLDVISLNYDLAVERAAMECQVPIERGISGWPDRRVSFTEGASLLRLHKVHGSLDWTLDHAGGFAAPKLSVAAAVADRPWLVVGDREKLATNGPTLELLHAASEALERADHLIIIGYGFGDTHVNNLVRDWLERDQSRTLAIVDPSPAPPAHRSFKAWLIEQYGEPGGGSPDAPRRRIDVYAGTAHDMLPEALAHRSIDRARTAQIEVVSATERNGAVEISVELRGAELARVVFSATTGTPHIVEGSTLHSRVDRIDRFGVVSEWAPGECARLLLKDAGADSFEILLEGDTPVGRIRLRAPVARPGSKARAE